MFQDQTGDGGAARAVPQPHLRPEERERERDEVLKHSVFTLKQHRFDTFPCLRSGKVKPSLQGLCCCQSVS